MNSGEKKKKKKRNDRKRLIGANKSSNSKKELSGDDENTNHFDFLGPAEIDLTGKQCHLFDSKGSDKKGSGKSRRRTRKKKLINGDAADAKLEEERLARVDAKARAREARTAETDSPYSANRYNPSSSRKLNSELWEEIDIMEWFYMHCPEQKTKTRNFYCGELATVRIRKALQWKKEITSSRLRDHEEFISWMDWRSSPSSLIWISQWPGSGKYFFCLRFVSIFIFLLRTCP